MFCPHVHEHARVQAYTGCDDVSRFTSRQAPKTVKVQLLQTLSMLAPTSAGPGLVGGVAARGASKGRGRWPREEARPPQCGWVVEVEGDPVGRWRLTGRRLGEQTRSSPVSEILPRQADHGEKGRSYRTLGMASPRPRGLHPKCSTVTDADTDGHAQGRARTHAQRVL